MKAQSQFILKIGVDHDGNPYWEISEYVPGETNGSQIVDQGGTCTFMGTAYAGVEEFMTLLRIKNGK